LKDNLYPEGKPYDERLFSANFRGSLHNARFSWLRQQTVGLSGSVLELGCHNARSIAHLAFVPTQYLGLDADWEGGLAQAREKYPEYEFIRSTAPAELGRTFDLALCLETIEHVSREDMRNYLRLLAAAAPVTLFSIPNEIGPVFVLKRIAHTILRSKRQYSAKEFFLQSVGRTDRVAQEDHKGFNYRRFLQIAEEFFTIEEAVGLPFRRLPSLSFTVAIRARSRLFGRS
jgi:SAM-dependent methyltransferase